MTEIPSTVEKCAAHCDKGDLNLLGDYVKATHRVERGRLVLVDEESSDSGMDEIYLGTKSAKGEILKFHDYDCLVAYFNDKHVGKELKFKKDISDDSERYAAALAEGNPDEETAADDGGGA